MTDLSVRSAPVKRRGVSADNRSESFSKQPSDAVLTDRLPQHWAFVRRVLENRGISSQDSPDAAQDVFIAVLRHWPEYDRTRPLRPWLFGFAVRIAAGYRSQLQQRNQRIGQFDSADVERFDMMDEAPSVENQLIAREQLIALDGMDPRIRDVLMLHAIYGLSGPDVAKVLSIPLNTAYTRLRRARMHWAAFLRRERAKQCRGE